MTQRVGTVLGHGRAWRVAVLIIAMLGPATALAQQGPDPAEDDFYYACGLDQKGHTDLALQEYQKFLKQHPGHSRIPEVLYRLGLAAHKVKNFALSESTLGRLVKDHPDYAMAAEAWFRRGDCLLELKRPAEAALAYGQAARLGGKGGYLADRGLYWQGEAHCRAGEFEATVQALSALRTRHEKSAYLKDGLLTLAYALYQLGQHESAIEAADDLVARFPEGPHVAEARYWKGEALLRAGRHQEAVQVFEPFVKSFRNHRHHRAALEGLAWARYETGDRKGAAEAYERLARESRGPDAATCWLKAAQARFHAGEYKQARSRAEQAFSLGGDTAAESAYVAALAAARLDDDASAVTWSRQALDAGPDAPLKARILVHAAGAMHRLGRPAEAAATYDLAAASPAIGDLAPQATYHAGLAHGAAGEIARAEERFQTVVKAHPKSRFALDARFALAENALHAGDYPRAVGRYRAYLKAFGKGGIPEAVDRRADAWFQLGSAALHAGDRKTAVEALQQHLTAAPEGALAAEARYNLGLALQDLGQARAAEEQLTRCVQAHPDTPFAARALLALGQAASAAGQNDQALKHFARLRKEYPGSDVQALARYDAAQVEYRKGDLAAAERTLTETLKSTSDADLIARARFSLARVLLDAGRFEDAVRYAGEVRRMEGGTLHAEAQELAGYAWLKHGQPARAEAEFRGFLKRYPDHALAPSVALNLGIALKRLKRAEEAAVVFKELLRAHPKFARLDHVRYQLALVQADLGNPDAAALTYDALLRNHPKSELAAEVRFRLGEHRYARKEWDRAVAEYEAVAKSPGHTEELLSRALYKAGWAQLKAGRTGEAAGIFDRLGRDHARSPLRGEALFQAGRGWQQSGKPAEALERFQSLVRDYPHHQLNGQARVRAGECCLAREKWADALRWFTAAHQGTVEEADRPVVDHGLGVAYQMTGQLDSAVQAFQRVTAAFEGALAAECQFRIGQCLAARHDQEGAVGAYLKVSILYEDPTWGPRGLFEAGVLCQDAGQASRARRLFREVLRDHADSPWAAAARDRLKALGDARKP